MSGQQVRAVFAQIPYQVTLSTEAHQWLADVSGSSGGENSGPDPHQLLLSSLGACTAITVAMYAKRKAMPLDGIHVELSIAREQTSSQASTEIIRTIELRGALEQAQRLRLLEVANACPIHKVLQGTIEISSRLN